MNDTQGERRCAAQTLAGTPCKNYPLEGSPYCRVHQPGNRGGERIHDADGKAARATSDQNLRQELIAELQELAESLQTIAPESTSPPSSPRSLLRSVRENLGSKPLEINLGFLEKIRSTVSEDLLDADTWKGIWYILSYSVDSQRDFLKRRLKGDYETDEWGLDLEVVDAVKPFLDFMYNKYWRVQTSGMGNIPEEGRALLVVNHSGQVPWDGIMVSSAVYNEHSNQRLVRTLYSKWLPTLPFFSALFSKLGQALDTEDNGKRLLEQDQLVAVFPEGHQGMGKLFKERYQLARFGRGDFIRMALSTQAPIIPVSVIGAEETYVSLAKSDTMAKVLGIPYFPISATWPWLGPLGLVPLPTKWYIDFGEPIPVDSYGPEAVMDLVLVSELTDQVRYTIQEMINSRLAQRQSVFLG